jgi:hypothetical protein
MYTFFTAGDRRSTGGARGGRRRAWAHYVCQTHTHSYTHTHALTRAHAGPPVFPRSLFPAYRASVLSCVLILRVAGAGPPPVRYRLSPPVPYIPLPSSTVPPRCTPRRSAREADWGGSRLPPRRTTAGVARCLASPCFHVIQHLTPAEAPLTFQSGDPVAAAAPHPAAGASSTHAVPCPTLMEGRRGRSETSAAAHNRMTSPPRIARWSRCLVRYLYTFHSLGVPHLRPYPLRASNGLGRGAGAARPLHWEAPRVGWRHLECGSTR